MDRQRQNKRADTRRSARITEKSPLARIARGAGLSLLFTCLFSFLLLLTAAGISSAYTDPDALLFPLSLLILALSSILCGMTATRLSRAEPLPTGLFSGVLWVLFTFLLSFFVGDGVGALPSVYSFALRIPQLLLVLLGAFIAKRRPRRISPHRRR